MVEFKMIKVFVVDDQLSIRQGLRMQIALQGDMLVVGEAGNGFTALELIAETKPDVVVMDLDMPGMDGVDTLQALRDKDIHTPVIILSIHADQASYARAKANGAAQFVEKQASVTELFTAIHQAAERSE
jgi:DNA-binding NarL/FixJ family response regulator